MTMLQVLVVEDSKGDLDQYLADFPAVFGHLGIPAQLHGCDDFDKAFKMVSNPLLRFDLIVSDTYSGSPQKGDAKALGMVNRYRTEGKRFCPLVVYSSSAKPSDLTESDFVKWADKAKRGDIETAIQAVLETGVPQIARKLHDELERSAGSFLWEFLEQNWQRLAQAGRMDPTILERLVRRRAAIQIGDMMFDGQKHVPIQDRAASEYYIYPRVSRDYYSLGDILRHNERRDDFRVVLTPHCHLFKQEGQQAPRADYVLTVKTVLAQNVLGDKIANTRAMTEQVSRHKKLGQWSRSPAQTERQPEGRHWYLPGFLDIPHLFCDFLQVESIPYNQLEQYQAMATLVAPYAEAMQSCFAGFYASVGIARLQPASIESLLG